MNIARIIDKNTIHVLDVSQFDVGAIMNSGQVFRFFEDKEAGRYSLISGGHKALVYRVCDKIEIKCDNAEYFFSYFDLVTDYSMIKNKLSKICTIKNILDSDPSIGGIRILKGDFVEMVISFIISANNNIKRFTKTLNALSEKFGSDNCFPTLEELSVVTGNDFKNLGCGYRAPYLVKAIKQLQNLDYNILQKMFRDELNKTLLTISGVGQKVASCIMLFAFNRLKEVPVDTWIKKALDSTPVADKRAIIQSEYAGVAQQYIFYYLQHLKKILK